MGIDFVTLDQVLLSTEYNTYSKVASTGVFLNSDSAKQKKRGIIFLYIEPIEATYRFPCDIS
jgi:hypothetical protein